MSDPHVGTWLNDHHALAIGAIELARRCRRENAYAPYAEKLDHVIRELETTKSCIEEVLDDMDRTPDRIKDVASWLAEKFGRLKLNNRLTSYSALSRLEELETLLVMCASIGVMWRSLERVRGADAKPGGVHLTARAEAMESTLDDLRSLLGPAADEALAPA